ncbi:unnamed protein product, partial [Prorocentrum cordatum]
AHCSVAGLDAVRLEEEYRKRVFYYEERDGPFPVAGQEVRRAVSAHARHQTHSYPGTHKINHDLPLHNGQERGLSSCAVCAMIFWKEDLEEFELFDPRPAEGSTNGPRPDLDEDYDGDDGQVQRSYAQVHSRARKLNDLLSADAYMDRWRAPESSGGHHTLPRAEVYGTSVVHPWATASDGTACRWILDTTSIPVSMDGGPGLLRDNTLQPDSEGRFPSIPTCLSCRLDLSKKTPLLPRYALANDNLILREPVAFRKNGAKLSPMTFAMLALARMLVRKIIAEKTKKADPRTKQKGLRSNSICFPQAYAKELVTQALPAEPEVSQQFFADGLSIALAGASVDDLDKATWAEVPREAYMTAVRFCVAHSEAYHALDIDENEAARRLQEAGHSCAEVLQQATRVEATTHTPHLIPGPATLDAPEIPVPESIITEDGRAMEDPTARPTPHVEPDTAPPPVRPDTADDLHPDSDDVNLHCAATDFSTGALDADRAACEFAAKLELLSSKLSTDAHTTDVATEIESLQALAKYMNSDEYRKQLDSTLQAMEAAESREPGARQHPDGTWAIPTGKRPLSMYDKEFWQKAFPHLFPYGDGVYGIDRRRPLSFQQWCRVLLLRAELRYQVHEALPHDCPLIKRGARPCAQCARATTPFVPPAQPRWGADLDFLCVLYDSWRRMELTRRAGAHVRRRGFQTSVNLVCQATGTQLRSAFDSMGDRAGFRECLLSDNAPASLREAVRNLLFFSSDVVGSEGARQQLRHEQMGDMLRFGGIGGFLTPNVADTRNPLVVILHAGSLNHTSGGLDDDGATERYSISLLDENPTMPTAQRRDRLCNVGSALCSKPSRWQREDKFDGDLEGDRKGPTRSQVFATATHDDATTRAEAAAYAAAFAEDHWDISSLSGHIHQHHDTCFKYMEDGISRKPQHCRFGFVHFVRLWLPSTTDSPGQGEAKERIVERLLARVGKEPLLPRIRGQPPVDTQSMPILADTRLFTDGSLGASVETDDRQARRGRINTVRFNPREGSTTMAGKVAHRGNLDYQDCRRTLTDGYEYDNSEALAMRTNLVYSVVESIRSGIQTSFYTCDYNTKPNMTCVPLLQHLTHGMEQLEAQMKKEHDTAAMKAYLQKGAVHNADCRPGALVGTAHADPTCPPTAATFTTPAEDPAVRLSTDAFYDDWLHRGFLRPFPPDVARRILGFVSDVIDYNAEALRLGNTPGLDNTRAQVADPTQDAASTAPFTSFGVHDEQLTPKEFFALITVESSANWNFMAEARKRPRPALLHKGAFVDDDAHLGLQAARADVGDIGDPAGADPECDDGTERDTPTGVQYKPHVRVRDSDVLDVVHRHLSAGKLDKRSGDRFLRIQEFLNAKAHLYEHLREPRQAQEKMQHLWGHLVLAMIDEASLADPQLLTVLNARANWGRHGSHNLDPTSFTETTFGNILAQIVMGDFMQLNPVRTHSLLQTFLRGTAIHMPRAPTYDGMDKDQRIEKERLDKEGWDIFDRLSEPVILFHGCHRFVPGDPLPEIFKIMRTPGGQKLPPSLKEQLAARCVLHRDVDQRADPSYILHDQSGAPTAMPGFFAQGYHSAINWETVGALWLPAVSDRVHRYLQPCGQLLYYVQAVDIPHQAVYRSRPDMYTDALQVANMSSKTPGWVLLDRLPRHVEFRADDATEDYTGLNKPGV